MGSRAFRAFDKYSIGFAIYLILSSTSAWGLLSFVSMSTLSATGTSTLETMRSVGYIGILLLFGLGCLYAPARFKRNTIYHSTVCLLLGYSGLSSWMFFGIDSNVLLYASAMFIGAGSSLSFIVWQRYFAEQDSRLAFNRIIVGSILSAALYIVIMFVTVPALYIVIIVCLVILNAFFLFKCKGTIFEETPVEPIVREYKSNTLTNIITSTWRYMLCIAAIGYVGGVSRILAQQNSEPLVLNLSLALGMLIATVIFGLLWISIRGKISFRLIYSVLFFGVMTGFLFLPFFDQNYHIVFAGISNAAFSIASILMVFTCIKIAKLRQVDPVGVFGIFASIVYGGVLGGRMVGYVLGQSFDISQILVIALMSVYLLSFSGIIISSRKSSDADIDIEPLPRYTVEKPKDDGLSTDVTLDQTQDNESSTPPPLVRKVIVTQDMVPIYCQAIKKTYALSNRETDVLELIVRGRDVARIAETLFVSENTVRSHCKNLYRKLDVHSRQQVFDLVEEYQKKEGADVITETLP